MGYKFNTSRSYLTLFVLVLIVLFQSVAFPLSIAFAEDTSTPISAPASVPVQIDNTSNNNNSGSQGSPAPISAPISIPVNTGGSDATPSASPISAPLSIPVIPIPVSFPVIFDMTPLIAKFGDAVSLNGLNFDEQTIVKVGGFVAQLFYTDGYLYDFIVPNTAGLIANQLYSVVATNQFGSSITPFFLKIAPSIVGNQPNINSNQTIIDQNVTLDPSKTQVVVTNTNFDSNINVPASVNNATLDLSNITSVSAATKSATLNNVINISSVTSIGTVNVAIPAGAKVSGPASWNGVINLPTVLANSSVNISGNTTTSEVVEIGFGDTQLTFDKAVRIVLPNQAGKLVGYSRNGTFTEITNVCASDAQAAGDVLATGADCKINSGSDLIIWTKHFTKFATYSVNSVPTGSNGGVGTANTSAPVCNDTKPQSAPRLTSYVINNPNEVTLNWTKATEPVTYYLIAYGTKADKMEFGNPNIGDKNATSYTIKNLNGGTTYYFRVRAGNSCMPGEYSNTFAIKTYGSKIATPATGFKAGVLSTKVVKHTVKTVAPKVIVKENILSIFGNFIQNLFSK